MKYLKQILVLLAVCFVGELLHALLPLPVPGSIYGLVLMLAALLTGVIKLSQIENVADMLLQILPVMFVPAGVGLMVSYREMQGAVLAILVISMVTTLLVMAVTGRMTQWLLERKEKKNAGCGGGENV